MEAGALTRREFVELSALLLLSSCSHLGIQGFRKTKVKFLIANAPRAGYGNSNEFVVTPPGSIVIFNTETGTISDIKIDFFGHTFLQNSFNKNLVYTFGQYGMMGAIVDIESEKCLSYIKASPFCTFMGHAGFIEQKNLLYTTEHDHTQHEGFIVFRDPINLNELNKYKTSGGKPHDTTYIKSHNLIVVLNAEAPSSLVYIDATSAQVVDKKFLIDGHHGNYSHFEISSDGWTIVLPRRSMARINLIDPSGHLSTFAHPETTSPGTLSACFIKKSNFVAVTYPEAGFIQIWNYKTKANIATIKLPNPRGVVQIESESDDFSSCLVSVADTNLIVLVDIYKNEQIKTHQFHSSFGGKGSHIVSALT